MNGVARCLAIPFLACLGCLGPLGFLLVAVIYGPELLQGSQPRVLLGIGVLAVVLVCATYESLSCGFAIHRLVTTQEGR